MKRAASPKSPSSPQRRSAPRRYSPPTPGHISQMPPEVMQRILSEADNPAAHLVSRQFRESARRRTPPRLLLLPPEVREQITRRLPRGTRWDLSRTSREARAQALPSDPARIAFAILGRAGTSVAHMPANAEHMLNYADMSMDYMRRNIESYGTSWRSEAQRWLGNNWQIRHERFRAYLASLPDGRELSAMVGNDGPGGGHYHRVQAPVAMSPALWRQAVELVNRFYDQRERMIFELEHMAR